MKIKTLHGYKNNVRDELEMIKTDLQHHEWWGDEWDEGRREQLQVDTNCFEATHSLYITPIFLELVLELLLLGSLSHWLSIGDEIIFCL